MAALRLMDWLTQCPPPDRYRIVDGVLHQRAIPEVSPRLQPAGLLPAACAAFVVAHHAGVLEVFAGHHAHADLLVRRGADQAGEIGNHGAEVAGVAVALANNAQLTVAQPGMLGFVRHHTPLPHLVVRIAVDAVPAQRGQHRHVELRVAANWRTSRNSPNVAVFELGQRRLRLRPSPGDRPAAARPALFARSSRPISGYQTASSLKIRMGLPVGAPAGDVVAAASSVSPSRQICGLVVTHHDEERMRRPLPRPWRGNRAARQAPAPVTRLPQTLSDTASGAMRRSRYGKNG